MMRGELKEKVVRGVAWSFAEKVGSATLQLGVSMVVLRQLQPADTDPWAILTAIVAVALIVVDSGFSQTLIRKPNPTPEEYKSVFVCNIVIALVLYVVLVAAAPFVAWFYDMPRIGLLAPVLFLLFPINALCVIQNTIFTRQMRFALMSKVIFISSFVSGLVAVTLALSGFGLWSFVWQRVVNLAVRAGLLWWLSDWRPKAAFDGVALRQMAPFSLRLMVTDLISTIYNKIPQFFIGRLYPKAILGIFDQSNKIKDQALTSTMQSVQNVTYPALSRIGDDAPKFAESYRQVVMVTAFVLFPVMIGMMAIADDLFPVLIGEQWLPAVPYFRIICLTGLFYPIAMVAYNVLKVRSNGKIIVRLEVLKKIIMTVIFAVTIPQSAIAIVWGLSVMSCVEMCLNVGAARRFTQLTLIRMGRTLLPILLVTAVMYLAVTGVGMFVDDPLLRLLVKIGVGMLSYGGVAMLFRLEAFQEVSGMVRRQLKRA